jgi:dTDP-4-dehydrorhamnose reductase
MHLYKNKVLNLRIRMPIVNYHHPRNFITKITNYEKICSMPNSMTVLNDFYPIIYDMMKKETSGTFNMCNKGLISHNEILEMYREIVNSDFKWNNFTIEEQNSILSSKRSNNYLSTNKLKEFGYDIPDIKESVRNALLQMKQQQ